MVVAAAFGAGPGDLGEGDGSDGFVGLAVAAAVEASADDSPGAGLDGGGAVGHGELCLGRESLGVADFGEDVGRDQGADAIDLGHGDAGGGDGGGDLGGEAVDLAVQLRDGVDPPPGDLGPAELSAAGILRWYPQRICSRSLWSRLMCWLRALTSSRR